MKKSDPEYGQYVSLFKERVCRAELKDQYGYNKRTGWVEATHKSCKWRGRSLAEHPHAGCLMNTDKVAGCRLSCKHNLHPSRAGVHDMVLEDL